MEKSFIIAGAFAGIVICMIPIMSIIQELNERLREYKHEMAPDYKKGSKIGIAVLLAVLAFYSIGEAVMISLFYQACISCL